MTIRELKDNYDQPIALGDALLYAVKYSSSVSQHFAFVYGIELRGKRFILKVVSARKNWRGVYSFYKTTLTARNFVRVPMELVHKDIKEELLKRLP